MNANLKKAFTGFLVLTLAIVACTEGSTATPASEPDLVSVEATKYGTIGINASDLVEIDLAQAMFVPATTMPGSITAWRVYDLTTKVEIGFVTFGQVMTTTNALTLIASLALGNTVQNVTEGRNLVLRVENPDGSIAYWEVNPAGQIVNQTTAFTLDASSVQEAVEPRVKTREEQQMSTPQPTRRVAYVENKLSWQENIVEILANKEVTIFPSCEVLLAALTANSSLVFDLYLLDNDLGKRMIPGPACVAQIRALRPGAMIKGFSMHDKDPGFANSGADGWISKSTKLEELENLFP